jgi:hypothetical protein
MMRSGHRNAVWGCVTDWQQETRGRLHVKDDSSPEPSDTKSILKE